MTAPSPEEIEAASAAYRAEYARWRTLHYGPGIAAPEVTVQVIRTKNESGRFDTIVEPCADGEAQFFKLREQAAMSAAVQALRSLAPLGEDAERTCTECGKPLVLHCADCDNLLWDTPDGNGIVTITQMQDDRVYILRTHKTEGQQRLFFGSIDELRARLANALDNQRP